MPPHWASAAQYGRPLKGPGAATTLSRLSTGAAGTAGSLRARSRLRLVVCACAVAAMTRASVNRAAFASIFGTARLYTAARRRGGLKSFHPGPQLDFPGPRTALLLQQMQIGLR